MAPKTFSTRPMNQGSDFNNAVDIIIPFHGQYEKVTKLLASIFTLTRSNYYTVCLVDDASPNFTFLETMTRNAQKRADLLKIENIVKTIRNVEQLGFGGACQVGLDATENPYVCFLNSDCLIENSNWLRAMGESLLNMKHQNVRMVSSMTNNPVGGDEAQKGKKTDQSKDDIILQNDSFLSLYCVLCHRELFSRCGFFKHYPLGGYEDQEFAVRMKSKGFRQAVCRNSYVYHEGECTFRTILRNNPNAMKVVESNRSLCIEDIKLLRQNQNPNS